MKSIKDRNGWGLGAYILGVAASITCGGATEPAATTAEAGTSGGATTAEATAGPATTGEAASTAAPPDGSSGSGVTTTSGTGDPTTTGPVTTEDATTGPPPVGLVPVFLAQGHHGRTTISCDDGLTWILDTSDDDAARCFTDGLDCDHEASAGRGIAYGKEAFVLTWGWGAPGTLERSADAYEFVTVLPDTKTFADVAFGDDRFVAGGNPTWISDDGGLSWQEGGPLGFKINYRSIEFVPHDGGVFIVTGSSGDVREIVRSPDGVTWAPASVRPPECGTQVGGVAYGDGVTLLSSNDGFVCRSLDGGDTWTKVDVADGFSSVPVWTGEQFYIYSGKTLHASADGESWASEPIVGDVPIGAMARSPGGTFVAVNSGWQQWYEKQRFARSTDGKTWKTLPEGAYTGSHPIRFIAHGAVTAGMGCPAP